VGQLARAEAARRLQAELRDDQHALRALARPDSLRRDHDRLDHRARGAGPDGRTEGVRGHLQPLARGIQLGLDSTLLYYLHDPTGAKATRELDRALGDNTRTTRGASSASRQRRSRTPAFWRSRPRPTRSTTPRCCTSWTSPTPARARLREQHRDLQPKVAAFNAAVKANHGAFPPAATAVGEPRREDGRQDLELAQGEQEEAEVVRPGRLGVLGWPVAHSRSPAMHEAAFAALGLEGSATSCYRSRPSSSKRRCARFRRPDSLAPM